MFFNFRKCIEISKNKNHHPDFISKIIIYLIIFVLTMHVFIDAGFSENVKFISDFILLLLVIAYVVKHNYQIRGIEYVITLSVIWFLFLAVRTAFGSINVIYCIFALRNWYRGIVFFIVCVSASKMEMVSTILESVKVIYCIDFAVLLIKYLSAGIVGDDLCGILWDNGATNVIMCVMLTVSIFEYLVDKKWSFFFYVVSISSMITAGLAELKIYFIEFWIIIFLALIIMCVERFRNRYSFRLKKIMILLGISAISFAIGVYVLGKTYPESINVLFSIGGYEKYEETSRAAYKISRAHAFEEIFNTYFHSSMKYNLLGFGFGTTFAVNTHLFYACHQKLYFEGGIISYLLFNAIIIGIGIKNFIVIIKGKYDTIYNKISLVMAIICVILTIYDSSMYKEISYVIYFVLACGDISTKEALEKELINEQRTAAVFEPVE